MVGFSAFAEGGGFLILLQKPIYIYANHAFARFLKSQKQPQNKLFLRLKNNFFRSHKKLSKKLQKVSLFSNFLDTF